MAEVGCGDVGDGEELRSTETGCTLVFSMSNVSFPACIPYKLPCRAHKQLPTDVVMEENRT